MCPSGEHFYPRTVVSVHYENITRRISLAKSGPHHHLIENVTSFRHDIAEKLLSWR